MTGNGDAARRASERNVGGLVGVDWHLCVRAGPGRDEAEAPPRGITASTVSEYIPPPRVPGFLDPDDPVLFPHLTPAQIEELVARGETLSLGPGEVVFEQAQRDTPFFVVLAGAIDVIDRQPDGDHYFAQCQPGTFAADISMFTGEPTLARGVIADESSILVLPPDELRAVVAGSTELGDLLLRTMITRREWLKGQGYGYELLIGRRSSGEAFAIRELLERNLVPFSWHDIDTDAESQALLERLGIGPEESPVLVRTHNVLRCPTITQIADELGCAPRSINGPSTSSCSGRVRPAWPPRCTPRRRV
jgi:thioredoxin reductase (NADPH)